MHFVLVKRGLGEAHTPANANYVHSFIQLLQLSLVSFFISISKQLLNIIHIQLIII